MTSCPPCRNRRSDAKHLVGVGQQVAENHYQTAMFEHRGKLVEAVADVGFFFGLELGEQRKDIADLCPFRFRGEAVDDFFAKRDQPDGGSFWWIIR